MISVEISMEVHIALALEKAEKLWLFSGASFWYPHDSGVGDCPGKGQRSSGRCGLESLWNVQEAFVVER